MKQVIYNETKIKRPQPANFNSADDHLFKKYWKTIWPECHFLSIKNAYIIEGTIFLPNGFKFFDQYTHYNKVSIFGKFKRLLFFFLRKKTNLDKAIWIHDNFSGNYYHWFTECLPRFFFAEKYLNGHTVILPERFEKLGFITDSLNLLGIRYSFFSKNQVLMVSQLVLTSLIGRISEYHRNPLIQVKEKFESKGLKKLPKRKIYIRRKPAKARNILNEGDVLKVLEEFKVEVHYFENYSLEKQIKLMNETKLLVGIHGAGLTNMLFMPTHGSVLEFRNSEDGGASTNCYFNLASELGIKYYYTTNKSTSVKTNHADFEIEIDKLRFALSLILKNESI